MRDKHINNHGTYKALSKLAFLELLKKQDISIPERVEHGNRRRIAAERMVTFRSLATLARTDRLFYPLELVHNDKPDFWLHHGAYEVGIECSEAVSQEWSETDALLEREGRHVMLFEDNFRIGTPKRTVAERREICNSRPRGPGWGDDEMEHEWALGINKRVIAKVDAFNNPDFEKYHENWLFIWSNLPGIVTNTNTAMKYLMTEFKCYWSKKSRYDKLIVDIGREIIEIKDEKWASIPINNLWSQVNKIKS